MNFHIELSLFLDLNSPIEEKRINATNCIMTVIGQSQFLEYLLSLISNSEVQSQNNLFIQLLIVLKATIKFLYENCKTIDENFTKMIPSTLINLLSTVPQIHHAYIIDCFRQINICCFKNEPFLHSIQTQTLPFLVLNLKEQKNFLSNFAIFSIFIKYYLDEDSEDRLDDFFSCLFNELVPIIIGVFQAPEINEFTTNSTNIIVHLLLKLINKNAIILKNYFDTLTICSIVQSYCRYFPTKFPCSTQLIRRLLKLCTTLFTIYYKTPEFDEVSVPYFFNNAIQLLLSNSDSFIQCNALNLINQLYSSRYFMNEIESPQFISNILIPSAKLTQEDLEDLIASPSFVSFYFKSRKNDKYCKSKRSLCGCLAFEILQKPELYSIVAQKPADPIDFEARVFLLGNINPYNVNKTDIDFILSEAMNISNNPPFLQASFLYFLFNVVVNFIDTSDLVKLSFNCINITQDPVVALSAVNLLNHHQLLFSSLSESLELHNIIPKILTLSAITNCWKPLDIILKIVNHIHDCSPSLIQSIVAALFQNCLSFVHQEDPNEMCTTSLSETFHSIIKLINEVNDEIVVYCLNQCMHIFTEIKNEIFYFSLFNFISYFNFQTNTPIDEQFDILLFFLSRNSNTAQYVINIVYPLLLNPLSNLMNRPAFVQTICSIVSTFIHKIMVEKEMVLFGIEPLLRVCGAFIEVFGNEYIEMVKFAIYILKNGFIPNYYSAILYVIFNAMHVNGDFTLSLFDDEVLDILINHSVGEFWEYNNGFYKSELKSHFFILLELSRRKIERWEECIRAAISTSKNFYGYKHTTYASTFDTLTLIRCFPCRIDNLNEWEFFFEVIKSTGYVLSEYEQIEIQKLIEYEQS